MDERNWTVTALPAGLPRASWLVRIAYLPVVLVLVACIGVGALLAVLWLSGLTPMRKLWPAVVVLVPALIAWLVLR